MYLLSGLIFCGECGYAMHGNARYPAPNRPKLVTYRCGHKHSTLDCNNKEIKRDDIENFVINQLQKHLLRDELVPELTQKLNEYIVTNSDNHKSSLEKYRNRLKELENNKANIIEAIAKSGFADVFSQKLSEIESEINTVQTMLRQDSKACITTTITEDVVRQYLSSFKTYILKRDMPQIKKFIDSYVERVDVYRDKVKVKFKVLLSVDEQNTVEYAFENAASRKEVRTA